MYIQTNIAFQSMTGLGPSAWNRDTHPLAADIRHHYYNGHETEHYPTTERKSSPSSHQLAVTDSSHR